MSVSCTTSPTLTSTVLITTSVPTTDVVENVITADPTTSPIATSTSCLGTSTPSAGTPTCTAATTITEFTTIPGGVSTTRVTVTRTVDVTSTRLTTLFGTSCTTIQGPGNGNGNGNGNSSGSGNGNNGNGGNSNGNGAGNNTVISTPPPTVITSQSETTLPNGEVSTILVTTTSTLPASTLYTPPTPTLDNSNDTSSSKDKVDLGPAIGGALGGFFALLLIALAIWLFIIKRRRRWDDVFDKNLNDPDTVGSLGYGASSGSHSNSYSKSHYNSGKSKGRFSLGPDLEVEPKPYQYGIVGHSQSPSGQPQSNEAAAAVTSRPSTAGSNYPLLSGSGHHTVPSNSSSQIHTPAYSSPNTPTIVAHLPPSTPSHSHSQHSSTAQPPYNANEMEGFFGKRAGSPVSFTEGTRKLQVINASPPSIYGGQSLHQRMVSDGSEPTSPVGTPRNLSAIFHNSDAQTSGADPTKGGEVRLKERKSSLPPAKSGVLLSEDGPPKLILNL